MGKPLKPHRCFDTENASVVEAGKAKQNEGWAVLLDRERRRVAGQHREKARGEEVRKEKLHGEEVRKEKLSEAQGQVHKGKLHGEG